MRQTGTVPAAQSIPIPSPQGRSPQAEGTGAAIRQQPPGEKGQRLLPQEKGRLTDRAAAACVRGSYLKKFPSLGLEQNEVFLLGIEKYRVHEVAKDFGLPTKTITRS